MRFVIISAALILASIASVVIAQDDPRVDDSPRGSQPRDPVCHEVCDQQCCDSEGECLPCNCHQVCE